MSLRRLKQTPHGRTQRLLLLKILYPPYWDEGIRHKIHPDKARSYKSWKHNRMRQYKILPYD